MTDAPLILRWPGGELTLAPGTNVTVGRDPDNAIVLPSQAVSRRHGRLTHGTGGWQYEDLGSTQGTFRAGVAVGTLRLDSPTELTFGQGSDAVVVALIPGVTSGPTEPGTRAPSDHVSLGEGPTRAASGRVVADQANAVSADAPSSGPLRPGGEFVAVGGLAPATEVPSPDDADQLVVAVGDAHRTVNPRETLTIGREDDNGLVVTEPTVSRHHASLAHTDGRWVLSDLGSSAGTWQEGNRVSSLPLSGRQVFTLGDRTSGVTMVTETATVGAGVGVSSIFGSGRPTGRRLVALVAAAAVLLAAVGLGTFRLTHRVDKDALARATVRLVRDGASGSGTIIDASRGLVLTNAHVVAPTAAGQGVAGWLFSDEIRKIPDKIEVDVTEGLDQTAEPRFIGHVIAVDGYLDIAIVKIGETLSGAQVNQSDLDALTQVSIGDSDTARSGDPVIAIGYPGVAKSDAPTVTEGIVSGVIADPRLGTNRAQINMDATIAHGNSGGLAADASGNLVGVTTWGLLDDAGVAVLSSIRPINLARPVIEAAENGKPYTSPWVTPGPSSAAITHVDFAKPVKPQQISASCDPVNGRTDPLAVQFDYTGFPTGKQTDVMVALYDATKDTTDPSNRVAVAMTTLKSQYPTSLSASGCATATLVTDSGGPIPNGRYLLKIGVGGDLLVIKTATITLS